MKHMYPDIVFAQNCLRVIGQKMEQKPTKNVYYWAMKREKRNKVNEKKMVFVDENFSFCN